MYLMKEKQGGPISTGTEDLMLSGMSFIKIRTGSVLKLILGVHRITLGLDLRLDHLILLVECA